MHVAFMVHAFFDIMADEGLVEAAGIACRQQHDIRVFHEMAVIGESHGSPQGHIPHFGDFLSFFSLRDGADDFDVDIAFLFRSLLDAAHKDGRIDDRFRVRHAGHAGDPAGRCSHSPAHEIFLGLVAGIAHMRMDVDEARCHDQPGCVIDFIAGIFDMIRNPRDPAVFDEQILDSIQMLAGVYKVSILNQRFQLASLLSASRTKEPCGQPRRW